MPGRFSIEGIFTATDRFSGMMGRIDRNVGKFSGGVRAQLARLDTAASKAFGATKTAAFGVAAGATIAGAALTAASVPGLDFGEAIASVGAVSLMSRDQIADLEAEARRLGTTTKFSATQVANGMEEMGRAGFTNTQVIAGIAPMLSAAAAEGAEFAEVANVIGSSIKGMGLEMTDTGRVADVLTVASAATKSSILSLGESIAGSAATARQFNVPLEELTASVALLQDVGLDASVAGSAVNTMLTNLANPSNEVKAKMKALGISFQDAKGNMIPFRDVLGQFAKGAENAGGNMAQVALFADLVGLRGQKAAANLKDMFNQKGADGVTSRFDELVGKLKDANGAAEKMASIRLDQTKGDFALLKNNVEDLGITLFDLTSSKLRGATQGTTEWVRANQSFIKLNVIEAVDKGRFAIELFASGAKQGFTTVKTAVEAVSGPFVAFAGLFGDAPTWPILVNNLGFALGVVVPLFVGLAVASKVARVALFAFQFATKAVTISVWLANQAMWAWKAAQIGWILITNSATAATVRARLATIANTAATWLGRGAQVASTASVALATTATTAYAASRGAATTAENLGAIASARAGLATMSLAGKLGIATAAVGALMLAWSQWKDLEQASGGAEGVWEGLKSFVSEGDFFKGVDRFQNKKAYEEYGRDRGLDVTGRLGDGPLDTAGAPPGAPPADAPFGPPTAQGAQADAAIQAQFAELMAALTKDQGKQKVEIDIKAPPGTVDVKQPKGGGKVPIKLPNTGAFRPALPARWQ
jgi:TP901 family phage tail tape measure protein